MDTPRKCPFHWTIEIPSAEHEPFGRNLNDFGRSVENSIKLITLRENSWVINSAIWRCQNIRSVSHPKNGNLMKPVERIGVDGMNIELQL